VFVWNLSLKKYFCHGQEVIKTAGAQNIYRVFWWAVVNNEMCSK
jgi:hypothetical protein